MARPAYTPWHKVMNDPDHLPDLPAVHEFREHAGGILPPLQDLADCLSEILKAGAGLDLQFTLRLELPDGTVAPEQIARINDILAKVSAQLRLA